MADRSVPPDPASVLPRPNHLAQSALFLFAYEVSCRIRAERAMPYAPKSDSPLDLHDPAWVPRPPVPPGDSALRLCCCHSAVYASEGQLSTLPASYSVRTDNTPKVRFSAMVGEEPEVEVARV